MVGDASNSLLSAKPSEFIVRSPPAVQDRRRQSPRASPAPSCESLRVQPANVRFGQLTRRYFRRRGGPKPAVAPGHLSPDAEPSSAQLCDKSYPRDVRIFPARWSPPFFSPDVRIRRADYAMMTA